MLAGLYPLACSAYLHNHSVLPVQGWPHPQGTGPHPQGAWPHPQGAGPALPTSISNEKKAVKCCAQAKAYRDIFSIKGPSARMTPAWVTLT